jgi:hypothetical protein
MIRNSLKCGVLLLAFVGPVATCSAANGIGSFTGTSSPEVATPPLIGPTPRPSYLAPPVLPPALPSIVSPPPRNAPRALRR